MTIPFQKRTIALANHSTTPPDATTGDQLPEHVAIIMDGNGRWAKRRGLPRSMGHREGAEAVRRTVRAAGELGIGYLTIYSFSTENWSRPAEEVDYLMGLIKRFIKRDLAEMHQNNVRLRVIGERDGVDPELLALIDDGCELTRNNTDLNLVVAFNYGSRSEIASAARKLATAVAQGQLNPDQIDERTFGSALATRDIPDPDLLIRTSGEMRLSNFLLWQAAYAELVFLEECWPEFGKSLLLKAIDQYRQRNRRFGGLAARRSTVQA